MKFLSILLLSLLAFTVQATTYHVAKTGNDSTGTGTSANPWLTIHGHFSTLVAGDTLYIHVGTYAEKNTNITTVGTASSPVTLAAYPGDIVVMSGTGLTCTQYESSLNVTGQYITVKGMQFTLCGFGVVLGGSHNTLIGSQIYSTLSTGVYASGDYSSVINNVVHDTNQLNNPGYSGHFTGAGCYTTQSCYAGNTWGQGISLAAANGSINHYSTAAGNTVYRNWSEGLGTFNSYAARFSNNIVYDNFTTNIYVADTTHTIVDGNLAYISVNTIAGGTNASGTLYPNVNVSNLLASADEVGSVASPPTPASTNNIYVNNIFACDNSLTGCEVNLFNWTVVAGTTLQNAVFSNNTLYNVALGLPNVTPINNIIQNNVISVPSNGSTCYTGTMSGITLYRNEWSTMCSANTIFKNDVIDNGNINFYGTITSGSLNRVQFALGNVGLGAPISVTNARGTVTSTGPINQGAYPTGAPISIK